MARFLMRSESGVAVPVEADHYVIGAVVEGGQCRVEFNAPPMEMVGMMAALAAVWLRTQENPAAALAALVRGIGERTLEAVAPAAKKPAIEVVPGGLKRWPGWNGRR